MSTLSVTVTGVDGRSRTQISINASNTVAQLLRQACYRLKLTPDESSTEYVHYRLCHGRTLLDNSTSIRLSGISPGAKLDLVRAKGINKDAFVDVAIQTTNGRLTATFTPTTTLFSILYTLLVDSILAEKDKVTQEPLLVVMGQEYFGLETLAKTTLEGIGIASGNCLIRLMYKPSILPDPQAVYRKLKEELRSQRSVEMPKDKEKQELSDRSYIEPKNKLSETTDSQALEATGGKLSESIRETTSPGVLAPGLEEFERCVKLYDPPRRDRLQGAPNLPDSAYELGETEFRLLFSSAQARTRALQDAPLVSRAKLVERQQREFLAKHPTTRIRFRFPDQYQLEAVFRSTEPLSALFIFIQDCLEGGAVLQDLSIGPPPKAIRRCDKTFLWQHDLVPAAIINVALGGERRPTPLLLGPAFQKTATTAMQLSQGSQPSPSAAPSQEPVSAVPHRTEPRPGSSTTDAATKKKPSWLRLGH